MAGATTTPGVMTIRQRVAEERPREVLFTSGAEALSLSQLVAIILRTGTRGVNAEELARRLMNAFPGLRSLDSAPVVEICKIRGIGRAKAAQLKAALEVGKRLCREKAKEPRKISGPREAIEYVAEYFGPYLRDARIESLCVVFLDRGHAPIRAETLCRGGPDGADADPRELLREAVSAGAASILLVHNHPSGGTEPSGDDYTFTCAVKDLCDLFGVRLLDHVIVGKEVEQYFSFVEAKLL